MFFGKVKFRLIFLKNIKKLNFKAQFLNVINYLSFNSISLSQKVFYCRIYKNIGQNFRIMYF
jgi:hypothetical protein